VEAHVEATLFKTQERAANMVMTDLNGKFLDNHSRQEQNAALLYDGKSVISIGNVLIEPLPEK
jgi:hypothetical protein